MNPGESILDYLVRQLRSAGRPAWKRIALEAGVSAKLPEKLVYGERQNPTLDSVQPLLDYFADVEAGRRDLPASNNEEHKRLACPQS